MRRIFELLAGCGLIAAMGCGAKAAGDFADAPGAADAQIDAPGFDALVVSPPDGPPCGTITMTFRDFRSDHPDFEDGVADDRGLVATQLGVDRKPVFAGAGATPTVSGQASFDQWYRDVEGVNLTFADQVLLTETSPGHFEFANAAFFPLDDRGFPERMLDHNFHFTTEIHASFRYEGGEVFGFDGDDDVFVFVNGRLALDLGGVHSAQTGNIDFDARAAELGITPGNTYQLDMFHAERHTVESNFRLQTTIACLEGVVIE